MRPSVGIISLIAGVESLHGVPNKDEFEVVASGEVKVLGALKEKKEKRSQIRGYPAGRSLSNNYSKNGLCLLRVDRVGSGGAWPRRVLDGRR